MSVKSCFALLAAAATALSFTTAMAQNTKKPPANSDTGFFFSDLKNRVVLEYLAPGSKTAAFDMICPKGLGKIQFDEFLGTPQDGPITLSSNGKTLVLQGKKMAGEKGGAFIRAQTSTAEAAILGLRDSRKMEVTVAGAHYTAEATEGDRGEVGVFFTQCDEGDSL
jgi:hypothetical protein